MPSNKNRAVIACAGSGKTTSIVEEALALKGERALVVTYTNENLDEVRRCFVEAVGCVPPNVQLASWFVFLLHDGVRPYQNHLTTRPRVRTVCFVTPTGWYRKRSDYFTPCGDILRDKTAQFVSDCNRASGGLVVGRLERMYEHIFVDEVQDLAGYDLEFLSDLFRSRIAVTVVGDPRQGTFSTNRSLKHRQYRGSAIYQWLKDREGAGELVIEDKTVCYRSNQPICDFADALYPHFPKTTSCNRTATSHDGIVQIPAGQVREYVETYRPVILRYDKRTMTLGLGAMNIGGCKGRTYDRVVIFPTKPMLAYLETGDPTQAGNLSKFYVAVTRARFSVAFVVPDRRE